MERPPRTSRALEEIPELRLKRIRWLVMRMGIPASELDDVVQEVLQRIWEARDQIDRGKDVPAWLDHLTRNLACDHLRRLRRRAEVLTAFDDMDLPDERPGPEESARARGRSALLLRLIDQIDPGRRALFLEHELLERSLVEIAAEQGIPDETARKRYRLAREDLKAAAKRWQAEQRRRGSDGLPALLPLGFAGPRAWARELMDVVRWFTPRGPAFTAAASVILVTGVWPWTGAVLPPEAARGAMVGVLPARAALSTAEAAVDPLAAAVPAGDRPESRAAGATGPAAGAAAAPRVAAARAGAVTGEVAAPASARSREEILIERARATLGARGAANQVEARLLLEEHARDFPRGRLAATREGLMRQLR